MENQDKEELNQDTPVPYDNHPFSTILGAVMTYDRAGQTFVTSTNKPRQEPIHSDENEVGRVNINDKSRRLGNDIENPRNADEKQEED